MATLQQWFETLRVSIAQEHGKCWIVREVGATSRKLIGRCKLIRIWEDRPRSSLMLPLGWKATNATAILTTVGQIRILIEERNLPLQEAIKLNTEALGGGPQAAEEDFAGSPEVRARFLRPNRATAAPHCATAHPAGSSADGAAGQASPL